MHEKRAILCICFFYILARNCEGTEQLPYIMGFSLLSEMEFFAVPKNGISLNI